jgi:hypothetical protein
METQNGPPGMHPYPRHGDTIKMSQVTMVTTGLWAEPGQACVGDLPPAGVDSQGVTAVELLQTRNGDGVPVLLELTA